MTCRIEGCDAPIRVKSERLCNRHYQRWKKWGDPHRADTRWTGVTVSDRFWQKVDKTDDCWEWTAKRSSLGYGCFWPQERMVAAHRWAYEESVGPVPDGLDLDHLCRNRACVRPDHLEPVTHRENVMRGDVGRARRENTCRHGHKFTPENTYVNSKGARICRICNRASAARFRARKRKLLQSQGP